MLHLNSAFSYNFPALRGVQAGKEYFVVMCPLRLIPKIFLFDEEEIPAQYRAQRILNKNRIPDITSYIVENLNDYVFSSLTASIDGELEFIPFSDDQTWSDLGILKISLDSRFLINDGQHRRAAIEEALKIAPEIGDETISVVFFKDEGLKKSQQIFADLNRHAINTTTSIGILYDHRDRLSILTKTVVSENELLSRYTDNERVSLSKNSPKLFSLNHIYNTNLRLLDISKGDHITDDDENIVKSFWKIVCNTIDEWQLVLKKELSPKQVRMDYIVGHGVFLEALGVVGNSAIKTDKKNWINYLKKLRGIDWSRSNTKDWEGRAFNKNGRIQKNNLTIQLTANLIKQRIGLPLGDNDLKLEEKLNRGDKDE